MIYHDSTNFEAKKIQKWLRELMRDTIVRIAKVVQHAREKYWEIVLRGCTAQARLKDGKGEI